MIFKTKFEKLEKSTKTFFELEAKDINGDIFKFEQDKDKKLFMIINIASKWGLCKRNLRELSYLKEQYKDKGFEIYAFPCSQFFNQEFIDINKTKKYLESNFKVNYKLFDRVDVNGKNSHEIFRFLRFNSELVKGDKIKQLSWNFCIFFIDSNGKVIKFYDTNVSPLQTEYLIKEILN